MYWYILCGTTEELLYFARPRKLELLCGRTPAAVGATSTVPSQPTNHSASVHVTDVAVATHYVQTKSTSKHLSYYILLWCTSSCEPGQLAGLVARNSIYYIYLLLPGTLSKCSSSAVPVLPRMHEL